MPQGGPRNIIKSPITARLINAIVSILAAIIFVRFLPPLEVGIYYFLAAMVYVLVNFTNGISSAISSLISEETRTGELFSLGVVLHLIYMFLLVTVFYSGFQIIHRYMLFIHFTHMYAVIGAIAGVGLFRVASYLYTYKEETSAWANTGRAILTLSLQLFFIFGLWGTEWLIASIGFSSVIAFIWVWIVRLRVLPRLPSFRVIRETISSAKFTVPVSFISNIHGRVDVIILAVFVSIPEAGAYEAIYRLLLPGLFVASSISGLIEIDPDKELPKLEIRRKISRAMGLSGVIAIPYFFNSIAIPSELLSIPFGIGFLHGTAIEQPWVFLIVIAFALILTTYREPFNKTLKQLNRNKTLLLIQFTALVINIPLSIYLARIFGGTGVVLATVIIETIFVISYEVSAYYFFDGFIIPRMIMDQIISGVIMFFLVKSVALVIDINTGLELSAILILGLVSYLTSLAIISRDFRIYVKNFLQSVQG